MCVGIDADFQCLSFAGKSLQDSETLALYGVQDNSTLHLNAELIGGGKKRKKKTYTTPKKIKHKRTKVKMAILKYYKVDQSGKITRLRRECPNATCGAGVFMAKHKDRQYCGKCHLTYVFQKVKLQNKRINGPAYQLTSFVTIGPRSLNSLCCISAYFIHDINKSPLYKANVTFFI